MKKKKRKKSEKKVETNNKEREKRREETYVALAKLIEKVPAHDSKASTASVLSHDHED